MLFSKKLFIDRYRDIHERIIPHRIDSKPVDQLRIAHRGFNPVIWIYWHMVRKEDVGINRFILDEKQVYDRYSKKINCDTNRNGTGMTVDEVEKISQCINFDGLKAYRLAVKEKTLPLISGLDEVDLQETIKEKRVRQVICEEKTMPESAWSSLGLYYNKTKEWFLLHTSLTHPMYHLGQMNLILNAQS